MSSDEPTVTVDGSTEPPTSEPADGKPATKPSRARKAKESKAKKAPAPKKLRPRSPSAHPPYEEVTLHNTRFNFCFNIFFLILDLIFFF
jgi:histone H1/5